MANCHKCGQNLGKNTGKGNRWLCFKCSSYGREPSESEEPTFLLIHEISDKNLNTRLKEGFKYFQE